jgi:cysteine desulfurase
LHTDAAQSFGKVEVNVEKLQLDLLTVAGRKIYAPKGVGALYVRKGTAIDNFVHGAGQEEGKKSRD